VQVFDPATGAHLGVVRGLAGAQTVVALPDGGWGAVAELQNRVARVDPVTLTVTGTILGDDPDTDADEAGPLLHPDSATIGPDGRWYVASFETDEILRYEADGTFVDVFVAAAAGGLDGPDLGVVFVGDELYVSGWYSDRVHRYDGATGAPLGDLIGPADGLGNPRQIAVDPAGLVYVTGYATNGVLRYDPATGVTARWATAIGATGLAIDAVAGEVWVGTDSDTVALFDLGSGAALPSRVTFRPLDGVTAVELLPR
ncbi:MAG: hypothetical protein ABMB14_16925, partial [Myxococcota bacterium]